MDGANKAAFCKMHHMIQYLLDIKNLELKTEPNGNKKKPLVIVFFNDSEYVSYSDKRKSVHGLILYVLSVPVLWRPTALRCISLSSSEAECVTLLEAVKEIMLIIWLLKSTEVSVKLSLIMIVDSAGTIFIVGNITAKNNSKHEGIRCKYVNKYVEYGKVKIVFVKLVENDSDILTKNLF